MLGRRGEEGREERGDMEVVSVSSSTLGAGNSSMLRPTSEVTVLIRRMSKCNQLVTN